MKTRPKIGDELDVQFRAATGKRKLLAREGGVTLIHLASAWREKPKAGEWWRVKLTERINCKQPVFMVTPVRRLPAPQLPAEGLHIGDQVEVTFMRGNSGDPFARVIRGTTAQLVFAERTAWERPPAPGTSWTVRVSSCSDPRRGIFHVAPVARKVNPAALRPNDTVSVIWRSDPVRGVVGTVPGSQIAVRLDLKGGEWQKQVPLAGSTWKVRLLQYLHRDSAWMADVISHESGPKARQSESKGTGRLVVTFFANPPDRPHAFFNGIRIIPDRKWLAKLVHGDCWLVSVINRSGSVYFVMGVSQMSG